jgi:hypothetical protein
MISDLWPMGFDSIHDKQILAFFISTWDRLSGTERSILYAASAADRSARLIKRRIGP